MKVRFYIEDDTFEHDVEILDLEAYLEIITHHPIENDGTFYKPHVISYDVNQHAIDVMTEEMEDD